jgi:hypothetical protein
MSPPEQPEAVRPETLTTGPTSPNQQEVTMCDTCGCQDVSIVQPQVQPSAADVIPAGQPGGPAAQLAPEQAVQPAPEQAVQPAPEQAQPLEFPRVSPTDVVDPLISALGEVPAGSPGTSNLIQIVESQDHQTGIWVDPAHDDSAF